MEFEEEDIQSEDKWFRRRLGGILTKTKDKKSTPDGLWEKCPKCKSVIPAKDWILNSYVCTTCNYHDRIGSREYFELLFDNGKFTEIAENLSSGDPRARLALTHALVALVANEEPEAVVA